MPSTRLLSKLLILSASFILATAKAQDAETPDYLAPPPESSVLDDEMLGDETDFSYELLAEDDEDDDASEQPDAAETVADNYEEAVDDDDTDNYSTETTIDTTERESGLVISGDFRPIIDYIDVNGRLFSENEDQERIGFRGRLRGVAGFTDSFSAGARIAMVCFSDDACDPDFVMESASPAVNGLEGGQITFDELYLLWAPADSASIAVGRLQTRSVLRSGVYAKSLDRNDSNNVNVTWTDGAQVTFRERRGWNSNFVWQRNSDDGSGSIRRGPLDFSSSASKNTYFFGLENIERWGPITQRALNISYLPDSLLVDNDINGPRDDYWGVVGRLAARWPRRSEGIRLRVGAEVGYAPNTASAQGASLTSSADGLAWDGVISVMDFFPGHSIGVNYAQTGAGWYLSPQFRPNEELFEIRYIFDMTRHAGWPLLETRVRWREDLEQLVPPPPVERKASSFDFYLRLTWQFDARAL